MAVLLSLRLPKGPNDEKLEEVFAVGALAVKRSERVARASASQDNYFCAGDVAAYVPRRPPARKRVAALQKLQGHR